MDSSEAERVVQDRLLKLEPENVVKKIIAYVHMQDHPDQEMIRLAMGPDKVIVDLIERAKAMIMMTTTPVRSPPISPSMHQAAMMNPSLQLVQFPAGLPRPISPEAAFLVVPPRWGSHPSQHLRVPNPDLVPSSYPIPKHVDYLMRNLTCLEDLDHHFTESAHFDAITRGCRNIPGQNELPVKACHYFNKGFCKHGSHCRFSHVRPLPEAHSNMFVPNSLEIFAEDQLFSPGSLEKLDLEITELLKSRNGSPVSIASLPMLYHEKYGRTLQAEGYLTESQRHGRAGFSLTKLLAKLRNILIIDRPHGQHSVILAEDASKYTEIRNERNEPGPIVNGSRQIYLTFPSESSFTEDDVSNYFSTFGKVQDVRIPCQQKRMFGFVTFDSSDTVKMILSKGNPHYVCGSRVLVKPYREKSKLAERKYQEKFEPLMYYQSQPVDLERWGSSRLLRRQLLQEKHEQALEFESRRFSRMRLAQEPLADEPFFGYSMDGHEISKDNPEFESAEGLSLFNFLSNSNTNDEQIRWAISHNDNESGQDVNLPDSPFGSRENSDTAR